MALTVVRPCVVCGALMETKRASKQTCSDKCSKQNYRAIRREQQATQQTTIIEESNMSNKSQLFQPDPVHLKTLKDNETAFYYSRTQSDIQGKEVLGVMESFEIQGLQAALDKYVQLVGLGYTASPEVQFLPQVIVGPATDYVVLTLKKPIEVIDAELTAIHAEIEVNYLAGLEQAKAAAVAREVESLLAAERRKKKLAEEQAKAEKDAKEYARIEAEVLAALGGRD